ncbi:MAG TPA: MIP/aquaporin family protein [Pyrinomonadaceae bacterium]|nr:MIP/aquaporin family protein [Pyrinomonadaceae bacterium]
MNLARKLTAEFLGTAGLLAVVVGSGIMGENLAGGNVAIALLANTIATGAGLAFLILSFIDISGAHFNPAVSLTEAWRGSLSWRNCLFYLQAQILGAFAGVGLANLMFELPAFSASTKIRAGNAQFLSEFVATFGLIAVIQAGIKFRPNLIPFMVASYITSAYWFTSSTSFANPVVTLARSASNTFAGINPKNIPSFLIAQLLGAFAATLVFGWLLKDEEIENV